MATTSFEIKQNLDNNSPTKKGVNIPMFFSVESNGKTSYLLLTNHALPLSELPSACIDIIKSCSSFVTEESDEDAEEYYGHAVVQPATSKPWVDALPPEIALSLSTAVDRCFEDFHPALRKKLSDLKIWAAYQFAVQGYYKMLSPAETDSKNSIDEDEADDISLTEHSNDDSNSTVATVASQSPSELGMDRDLILNLFDNRTRGLETLLGKIPGFIKEANSINNLIELYNEVNESLNNETDSEAIDSGDIKKAAEEIHQMTEIETVFYNYRNAEHLFSQQYAMEENDDKELIMQNLKWLPVFLQYHNDNAGTTLFGIGARHGVGECGFLSLLPRLGFKVKILTPNATFEDYTYPFQSEIVSALALSQERITKSWAREIESSHAGATLLHQFNQKNLTVSSQKLPELNGNNRSLVQTSKC